MKPGSWAADVLDLLLPSGCVTCGAWIPRGEAASLVCGRCRSRLRTAPWPRCARCHFPRAAGRVDAPDCFECHDWPAELTAARWAYVLATPADDLVHALKYEGWPELASVMGEAMARVSLPLQVRMEDLIVVPTPTTSGRLRSRGYNQAERIAVEVAARLGRPLRRALLRVSEGRSQTALTPAERRDNVRGVFAPAAGNGASVTGADILLIDDVLTTGATAGEAARALARMGARSVTLLAFARALPSTVRQAA